MTRAKSNTLRAHDDLRDLIFSGALASGTDHLESELATRLGMSRTPVREATLMLEAQGLLEVRPRKGVRILSLSVSDMQEIYEVLTELESLAAGRAAARSLSDADLGVLRQSITDMDKALAAENREEWAAADHAFHTELVRLGGNSRVINIVSMMADQVHRARAMTLNLRPAPTRSNDDHRAVYDAIRRGDTEAAARIHRAHRTYASDMLTKLLAKLQISRV
jgi:DNA-binding GntR family transcriptional regulator